MTYEVLSRRWVLERDGFTASMVSGYGRPLLLCG